MEKIMRVLAINDVSCVGKCSLTVTLPILSAAGVTCDVLPTALLSTHTGGFTGYTFRDLTDDMPAILAHWKTLGLTFDCIYSGYLGNEKQAQTVLTLKREFLKDGGLFLVDPVMGDHYVTDGPFMFRSETGELFMIWSSFVQGRYAEYLVKFAGGELGRNFEHLDPLVTSDGGHGMIFHSGDKLYLTFHSPNASGQEHPVFLAIQDMGNCLV